jgi:hypothetical protein
MGRITLASEEAATVGGVLREIGRDRRASPDVRTNASYWAATMRRTMDRRDLQTVAWLLSEMSDDRRLRAADRRSAQYWATVLAARL